MSSKQIKIEDYFNIMRDDNGRGFFAKSKNVI